MKVLYQNFTADLESPEMVHGKTIEMMQIEKDKKRKQARNEDSYARKIRKIKKISCEEYMTIKLKIISAKIFKNKDCFWWKHV